jgi:ATP-dependent Lhr-like helicase
MLRGGRARLVPAGRWALLRDGVDAAAAPDAERWARLLLRRWGVVLRELLARETGLPPWRELVAALRRLEARGEVRGGRFVAGTVGEQFALPEAVETLRAVRRRQGPAEVVTIAAADPLNLVGILVPGARINPAAHETITWRDGEPVRVAASDAADDAVAERAG